MLNSSYLPGFGKMQSEMPAPNIQLFMSLCQEAYVSLMTVSAMEVNNFTDADLKDMAYGVVRQILGGTAHTKMGISIDDYQFEIEFVRDVNSGLGDDVQKLPKDDGEHLEDSLRNAIRKRKIINTLTQGFSLTNQSRMFDEDIDTIIASIPQNMLQEYFKFMRTSLESHKYIDIEMLKMQLGMMQDSGSAGGMIVPARMQIEYRNGKPIIIVQAFCLILAIQEMIKGVFEIVSMNGLKYEREVLRQIFDRTENWLLEYQGFIYGPRMAQIFKEYWIKIQDVLISDSKLMEYDDSLLPVLLSMMYDREFISDGRFIDIMANIYNSELDQELWDVGEAVALCTMYL